MHIGDANLELLRRTNGDRFKAEVAAERLSRNFQIQCSREARGSRRHHDAAAAKRERLCGGHVVEHNGRKPREFDTRNANHRNHAVGIQRKAGCVLAQRDGRVVDEQSLSARVWCRTIQRRGTLTDENLYAGRGNVLTCERNRIALNGDESANVDNHVRRGEGNGRRSCEFQNEDVVAEYECLINRRTRRVDLHREISADGRATACDVDFTRNHAHHAGRLENQRALAVPDTLTAKAQFHICERDACELHAVAESAESLPVRPGKEIQVGIAVHIREQQRGRGVCGEAEQGRRHRSKWIVWIAVI